MLYIGYDQYIIVIITHKITLIYTLKTPNCTGSTIIYLYKLIRQPKLNIVLGVCK